MSFPSPVGLLRGLGSVLVAQVVVLVYYAVMRFVVRPPYTQLKPPPDTTLAADLWAHVSAPGSFALLFAYLSATWMLRVMPASYYDLEAPLWWPNVLLQFVVVDFFTFLAHLLEHAWAAHYQRSHKAHHVFRVPKLFNAFTGSVPDTATLILAPLAITAQLCHVSCADYIAFGTLYATQFTLIHCEFAHPWEWLLVPLGVGTSADHNVHHALFVYNYGHFFMWWDRLYGTYRSARHVKTFRM